MSISHKTQALSYLNMKTRCTFSTCTTNAQPTKLCLWLRVDSLTVSDSTLLYHPISLRLSQSTHGHGLLPAAQLNFLSRVEKLNMVDLESHDKRLAGRSAPTPFSYPLLLTALDGVSIQAFLENFVLLSSTLANKFRSSSCQIECLSACFASLSVHPWLLSNKATRL